MRKLFFSLILVWTILILGLAQTTNHVRVIFIKDGVTHEVPLTNLVIKETECGPILAFVIAEDVIMFSKLQKIDDYTYIIQ